MVLPAIGRPRDDAPKGRKRPEERYREYKEDRRPKLIPEYQFKMQSIALKNELSPHMQDGPMDMKMFWQIIGRRSERDNPHLILFTIIRLGEPALAIAYMDSLPNVKEILNAPIPTKDRWLIHRACWEGCVPLLEAMITRGVSSDRLNTYNESPFGVVEQSVEQGIYGRDQAEKIKALLKKAATTPPPPPPRTSHQIRVPDSLRIDNPGPPSHPPPMLPLSVLDEGSLPSVIPPAIPSLASLLSSIVSMNSPWTLPTSNVAPVESPPETPEDSSWVLALQSSPDQTHVFISQIAFEVTPDEIKSMLVEKCGPIEKIHMPVRKLKKKDSFQQVATKLHEAGHQGKAIIKFTDRDSVDRALALSGEVFKGRTLLVARTRKSVKRKQKSESEMTLTEKLLGKYAKKKKRVIPEKEKATKGDTAWLDTLTSGPDQTHCYVNGIAFEATVTEVKKMFKKCGEIIGFHMPAPKVDGKGRFNEVKNRTEHCGKAVLMFRTIYGLRAALALNNTILKGRLLMVSKSRKTLKESTQLQSKREEKKRKLQEAEDANAQLIPHDVDNKESLDKEQLEAKAWTEKVMKQVNFKLAQEAAKAMGNSNKKRRRTEVTPTPALEPQDEFTLMLTAFKKTRAAMHSKAAAAANNAVAIGPEPSPPAEPSGPSEPTPNPLGPNNPPTDVLATHTEAELFATSNNNPPAASSEAS